MAKSEFLQLEEVPCFHRKPGIKVLAQTFQYHHFHVKNTTYFCAVIHAFTLVSNTFFFYR